MSTIQSEKKNILVVDDDPFIQRLFRKTLEREGFHVLAAVDGAEAIGMLPDLTVDLIILDLMLPKINGLKVLDGIRSTARTKDFPVLILSNAYLPEVAQKAMKAGANMGLPKSECSPARLVELVRQMATVPEEENDKQPAAKKSLFSRFLSAKPENPRQGGDMTTKSADNQVLPEARNELAKDWQTDVAAIRQQCVSFVKSVGSQESSEHLNNLYRSLRLVSARAAMGRCTAVCQLANAFEAMLFEHVFRLKTEMSPSVTQTMVQAVDCLEHLFKSGAAMSLKAPAKSKVLLVDDDPICNSANDIALRRADFETVSATDGMAALALCESRHFDLILLDINMPVLSGFEVCEKIRAFPLNKNTPVIFVTLHGDFQNRAQSVLSGASGLITKPISPLELIVKSMVFLLRTQRHDAPREHSHANKHGAPVPAAAPAKLTVQLETHLPKNGNSAPEKPLPASTSSTVKLAHSRKAEGHQTSRISKEQPKLEGRVKELQATQAAVDERAKALTEALAAETKRREEAEKQAEANARQQTQVRQDLEEAQKQLQGLKHTAAGEQSRLAAREKDLEVARKAAEAASAERASIRQQMQTLTGSLKSELGRRETAEKQVVELATQRNALEQELAQHARAQEEMCAELLAQQKRLDAQAKKQEAEQASLASRTKELEVAQAELAKMKAMHESVVEESQSLTESLKTESCRRAVIEKQAADLAERRAELEQKLAYHVQAQGKLQSELAEQRNGLNSQNQNHNVERANLTKRIQELENAHAALTELRSKHEQICRQADSLAESLKTEGARRAALEKESADLTANRAELERKLAERALTQEQLQTELAAQQKLLESRSQTHQVELGNLKQRSKELETAQTALAELKARHLEVINQSKSLAASLATESARREATERQVAELAERRAELEGDLAQRTEAHENLRTEFIAQKDLFNAQATEQQASHAKFTSQSKELEATQTTLTELRAQLAIISQQAGTLKESLATESERREAGEKQTADLAAQRAELEHKLALQTRSQAQLRAELDEHKKRIDAQTQAQREGEVMLVARTKELEASQATATELSAQHAIVRQQVQTLNESLKAESIRREAAEKQAAELSVHQAELEKELVQRTQNQERLQAEVAEHKTQLAAHAKAQKSERASLAARTKELEAAQAMVAELNSQHAKLAEQVNSLTGSLETEAGHRKTAEKQAAELAARRLELEADIAHRSQVQQQLSTELSDLRTKLDSEVEARTIGLQNLAAKAGELKTAQAALTELRAQHASTSERVETLAASLTIASEQHEAVVKQAAKLTTCRTALEHELAQRTQAQQQLSMEAAALRTRLVSEVEAQAAGLQNLSAKTAELKATQATLTELKAQYASATGRIEILTTTLMAESTQRETVEKQAAELADRRNKLEEELASHAQTRERLRAEMAEQEKRLVLTSAELDAFRNREAIHTLKQQRLAEQLVDSDGARKELEAQLATNRALAVGHEKSIQTLGRGLQRRTDEYERLDMLLRTEVVHRHRLQSQLANAESQLAGFGRELVQKNAAEQAWLKRDSELQTSLRFHQTEAVKAGATLAAREVEIRQARANIEELQVLQSALCTKVRELNRKDEAAAAQIQELRDNIARSENTAAQRQKYLAAMRYAILDSSRTSSRRQRERSHADQQQLSALRQLLWTFENTPLSTAQRQMLTEIQSSVSSLTNNGPRGVSPCPVELPELHQGEFCATEVIESAFRIVRTRSVEAGITARTSASGATGGTLYGDAVYIHQLIVLLAASPIGMDDVSALDLRVGIERMTTSSADLTVRVALSAKTSAQNLRARVEFIAAASANLKAGSFGETESGLAAGWQLTQALGAQAAIETEGDGEVCITLSLPIEMQSQIVTTTGLSAPPPSDNGKDHEKDKVMENVPAR